MSKKYTHEKRTLLILFSTLIFSVTVCYAQKGIQWTDWDKNEINGMELNVKSISGFTVVSDKNGFDISGITPKYEIPPNALQIPEHRNLIRSREGDFCAYLKFHRYGEAAWNRVRRDIVYSRGEEQRDPIDYATFLPAEYAKKKFNADEVITYPINLKDGPLKDKYTNCEAVCITKKERGFILIYCLYNNKKDLEKFRKKIEKNFWFREPDDFLNPKPTPSDTVIIVTGIGVQKKL